MRALLVILTVLAAALLIASRFYPTIEQLQVAGNEHYSKAEVLELAGLAPGNPLLWVTSWQLGRLVNDPWIARARVIRHWPDVVSVVVWERTPVLTNGETTWAQDGTVLPGVLPEAQAKLVRIDGWGPPRTAEALELVALLEAFEPKVIRYTPEGFEVTLAEASLFTPGVEALREHWAAFLSQRGRRLAVYPWGVSNGYD